MSLPTTAKGALPWSDGFGNVCSHMFDVKRAPSEAEEEQSTLNDMMLLLPTPEHVALYLDEAMMQDKCEGERKAEEETRTPIDEMSSLPTSTSVASETLPTPPTPPTPRYGILQYAGADGKTYELKIQRPARMDGRKALQPSPCFRLL